MNATRDHILDLTLFGVASYTAQSLHAIGQVAQLVERGPEKAGVGGSIPSLATTIFAMRSVPGAVATGFSARNTIKVAIPDPVATAPGTDLTATVLSAASIS